MITLNGSVRNLVIIFDQCINMYELVTSVCRAAYYHLKNIHCLKAFLTKEALVTVVHAFVTSRIDNCNDLLYGISDYNINRFQQIENSAAQIVTNTGKYDQITPILQTQYWLPVRKRFHFSILLIKWRLNTSVNWCPLESHPVNSGHPVRYYCRCQPPLCGIGSQQILEMRRLLNILNMF